MLQGGKGRNHSAWDVLGCRLPVEEKRQVTELFNAKKREWGGVVVGGVGGSTAERPSSRISVTLDGESKAQRGQALGPTAHGKVPPCLFSFPAPSHPHLPSDA